MQIEFDPSKRDKTLAERGLDFAHATQVFVDKHLTLEDTRENYEERRFQTVGRLDGRIVVLIWTPRGTARRVIRDCPLGGLSGLRDAWRTICGHFASSFVGNS